MYTYIYIISTIFFIIVIFAVQIPACTLAKQADISAILCFCYAPFQGKTVGHLPLSACATFGMT